MPTLSLFSGQRAAQLAQLQFPFKERVGLGAMTGTFVEVRARPPGSPGVEPLRVKRIARHDRMRDSIASSPAALVPCACLSRRLRPLESNLRRPPQSVAIILRVMDRAEELRVSLPSLLNQDYPDHHVVIVDHSSHDGVSPLLLSCTTHLSYLNYFIRYSLV